MHKIVYKQALNREDYLIEVEAPLVAAKFKPGQFVIVRRDEKGERIPLTVADCDSQKGLIKIIFKAVGKTTIELSQMVEGDSVLDVVGPLGNPSQIDKFGTVIGVGGGTGIACLYPIAKELKSAGNYVISILGAKTKELVIWENQLASVSDEVIVTTDDGSYGRQGVVTEPLKELISSKKIDRVVTIGPAIMMKFVCETTRPYQIKTIASLNTIMVDGTGMCGSCRVFVDGKMKLACIDGPEFDGHLVNFDDVLKRTVMFRQKEKEALALIQKGLK